MAINIPGSGNTQTIVKTPEQTIQEQLKQATPEAPEGPVTPPASPQVSIFDGLKDELETTEQVTEGEPLGPSPIQEMPVEEQPNQELQQQIMEAPDLFERQRIGLEEQAQGIDTRRYNPQMRRTEVLNEDGGLFDRANNFTESILSLSVMPSGLMHTQPTERGQAKPVSVLTGIGSIVNKLGGIQDNTVAPDFLTMASIVTENQLANLVLGADVDFEKIDEGLTDEQSQFLEEPNITPIRNIKKAQANEKLGMDVAKEWQRFTKVQAEPLSKQEASMLGDALKELYYETNKNSGLIRREEDSNGMVNFVVTDLGNKMFRASDHMRKMMFPSEHVRPLNAPRTGKTKVRYSGLKKTDVPIHSQTLLRAKENLESIGHIVEPRRLKILWSTLLPALSGDTDIPKPLFDMVTEIHSMGPSKFKEFEAKAKLAQINKRLGGYNPLKNMEELQRTIAQSAYGIAKERSGVKYLTYFIQAYNGRLTPEQTHFNPTTSKQVRFVTASPAPVIFKAGSNSRQEQNLIQMYAMMLVSDATYTDVDGVKRHAFDTPNNKGADGLLPKFREEAYLANEARLAAYGNRLKKALTMTDAESEAISQAIENGIAINDPNFPKLNGLGLDPEADSDLIQIIQDKGEDGPAFIDGLIDVANYVDAKNNKSQFKTHFNAYIDGKTNGIASNAMQLGNKELAFRVGVLRSKGSLYAIDNDLDIRADLAQQLTLSLDEGEFHDLSGLIGESNYDLFVDIAEELFNYKDLNKETTMTYGYGKEINNFKGTMVTALTKLLTDEGLTKKHKDAGSLLAKAEVLSNTKLHKYPTIEESIVEQLFPLYSLKLSEIMTTNGAAARRMMYGASLFHVMADELFEIRSPIGLKLRYGGMESLGASEAKETGYAITVDGKRRDIKTFDYESRATSAAIRDTEKGPYIGGYTFGGSIPGPVQSIDAATVALSLTNFSWDNLNKASNGNPYVHTIYDAFKLDANGYDVALRDINKAWLYASTKWSYLEETKKAYDKSVESFKNKIKEMPQDSIIPVGLDSPYRKIGELFETTVIEGKDGKPPFIYRKEIYKLFQRMLSGRYDKLGLSKEERSNAKQAQENFVRKRINYYEGVLKSKYKLDLNKDVTEVTPAQLEGIVTELMNTLQYEQRLDKLISETKKDKDALAELIKSEKSKIYQYYTH